MADPQIGGATLTAKPTVQVLLATYNGERFLCQQIESILTQDYTAQDGPALTILARDDGSRDGTRAILAEYAARFPGKFTTLPFDGASGSAKGNFLRLIQAADAEYVCFADQDDVWLPGKVSRSMAAMRELERSHGNGVALLVFSDLRVVDESLREIAPSMWRRMKIDAGSVRRLERLLGRSVVTGCTMMVNRRMIELARRMPEAAPMHDRWIALLASAMGAAVALDEPTVLYRQHGGNVIGAAADDDSITGIAARSANSSGRRAERTLSEKLAEEMLRLHEHEMPAHSAEILRAYLRSGRSGSAAERVWLTLRYGFFRGGWLKSSLTVLDLARGRTVGRE